MILPVVLSLLFYCTFMVYASLGYYELMYDDHPYRKHIFILLFMALAIWSFGFSMANVATDYEAAFFWRRFSALGWGSTYSIMLHLMLILTERKKILKKNWVIALIYLPAIVTILVFSIYSPMAIQQYNLINTDYGWSNVSSNNIWDWFFLFYYMSFILTSISLILFWGIYSNKKNRKVVAIILISSIATALVIGTITDVFFNLYSADTSSPQIAPVLIMFPLAGTFLAVKKYGFMKLKTLPVPTKEGVILTDNNRHKIYRMLVLTYLFGGWLYFGVNYFFLHSDLSKTVLISLIFIMFSIAINVIDRLKLKDQVQDWLMVSILCLTIPLIIFQDIQYANITIWAVPVILMILLIPFRNRKHLLILGITIIATVILLGLMYPKIVIVVTPLDYFVRASLLSIGLVIALYVNGIFIKRLKENDKQVQFQKMISKISAEFITLNEANYDEKIIKLLKTCGEHYQVDRVNLCLFSSDMKTVTFTHKWCNEGIDSSHCLDNHFQTKKFLG